MALALGAILCAGPPGTAFAAVLTRGPYLQVGTSTGITIRWRTDIATDSRVCFGPSPVSLAETYDDFTSVTEHTITLNALAPDARYYYSIGTTTQTLAGGTADYTWKTAPEPGTASPTRIWVIGDSGQPGIDQLTVKNGFLAWTGSRSPDVWLMLGDNAYDSGTDAEYQAGCFNAYPEVLRRVCLWPTRGNHDDVRGGIDYYDIFTMPAAGQAGGLASGTEAYYSFDYGNIHFVCLDSEGSSRSSNGPMATWLTSDLAATTGEWVIAYWHHPPYSKGSHDSDSESQLRDMRQNILPILEGGGVDLALAGHSHAYERSYLLNGHYGVSSTLTPAMIVNPGDGSTAPGGDGAYQKPPGLEGHQGAVYAVAGTGSKVSGGSLDHPAMVISLNWLGSMVIDVDGATLRARFLDKNGIVSDDFTIQKQTILDVPGAGQPAAVPGLALQVRPNPFSSAGAHFECVLPAAGHVSLTIYGPDGTLVARLVDRELPAGPQSFSWDGRDSRGKQIGPGVYFAALETRGDTRVQRLVRLR